MQIPTPKKFNDFKKVKARLIAQKDEMEEDNEVGVSPWEERPGDVVPFFV